MFHFQKFQITKITTIQSALDRYRVILICKSMCSHYGKLANNFEEGSDNA